MQLQGKKPAGKTPLLIIGQRSRGHRVAAVGLQKSRFRFSDHTLTSPTFVAKRDKSVRIDVVRITVFFLLFFLPGP